MVTYEARALQCRRSVGQVLVVMLEIKKIILKLKDVVKKIK